MTAVPWCTALPAAQKRHECRRLQLRAFPNNIVTTQVQTKRFDVSWWYRAELPPTAAAAAKAGGLAMLTFEGLNYRANVWVDGKLLATNVTTAGAYSYFDVDATAALASARCQGTGLLHSEELLLCLGAESHHLSNNIDGVSRSQS